ncbi:MAG: sugar ABC transporter permease [Paenibacillaceae bacterium]|nr:sugar ABC transporter permease [Paenibacillaceae bacterium]
MSDVAAGGRRWRKFQRNQYLLLLSLPGLLFFLLFKYAPMWGVIISFQKYSSYRGLFKSDWVGFEHFQRFFASPDLVMLLRNTFAINLLNLVFFFPASILLALLLNELRQKKLKSFVQSVVYLPHFLSWVIIAGMTYMMLSESIGAINLLLMKLGVGPFDFLVNPNYFWALLTLQSIWKEAGWGSIIFLAAFAGIDPQLYEAAKMDGANRLQQMIHVTLAGIRNVIFILLILRIGNIMDVGFEQVYLMMNGAVSSVADVIDTYVYRAGILQGQFSYSAAIGLFKSLVGLAMVIGANWLAKKFGEEGVY